MNLAMGPTHPIPNLCIMMCLYRISKNKEFGNIDEDENFFDVEEDDNAEGKNLYKNVDDNGIPYINQMFHNLDNVVNFFGLCFKMDCLLESNQPKEVLKVMKVMLMNIFIDF